MTEDNLPTARQFVVNMKNAGVDYVQFKAEIFEESFRIPFRAAEIVDELVKEFSAPSFKVFSVRLDGSSCMSRKDYKFCYAHRFIGAVSANGNIQLCCNLKHLYGDQYSLGNLNEQGLKEI